MTGSSPLPGVRLRGKTAVITGAANGIGYSVARLFAAQGARLAVADIDGAQLERAMASLPGAGHVSMACDLSVEASAQDLMKAALAELGAIDVLVNNAGILVIQDITDVTEGEFDHAMRTNVGSMVFCCKHALPSMLERRSGNIVNLASIAAFRGREFDGVSSVLYNLTKAAARQLAVSLATRYASHGIRANAVAPGVVRTHMLQHHNPDLTDEAEAELFQEAGRDGVPMGRHADPDEVAAAILFLASDDASYITGETLSVDGGMIAT